MMPKSEHRLSEAIMPLKDKAKNVIRRSWIMFQGIRSRL